MSYETNKDRANMQSNYLVVLKPRFAMDDGSWTLISGTIYKQSFTLGSVDGVAYDGTEMTEASSSSVASGEYYYDTSASEIYVNTGSNPSGEIVVVTYFLNIATKDVYYHETPDDTSTDTVFFDGIIITTPAVIQSASDNLFGFFPTRSTALSISNSTKILQKHLYDSSFNRASAEIYHVLGDLVAANLKKVFEGVMGDVSFKEDTVSINVFEDNQILDRAYNIKNTYTSTYPLRYYDTTWFSGLDPSYDNIPVRELFGRNDFFIPVNINYNATPTTSNNRRFACAPYFGSPRPGGSVNVPVVAGANTTTRTYVTSIDGITIDDWVTFPPNVYYAQVTNVNVASNYFDHTAIPASVGVGDNVSRYQISRVIIVTQDGTVRDLQYGRDWTSLLSNSMTGFRLQNNFETYWSGLTTFNPSTDLIYCRVFAEMNIPTFGGSDVGALDSRSNTYCNPIGLIYNFLKEQIGIPESKIDGSTFISLASSYADQQVNFTVQKKSTDSIQPVKEVINALLTTTLTRLFIDEDLKWTLQEIEPLGSKTADVSEKTITDATFNYRFKYQDIVSDLTVKNQFREFDNNYQRGDSFINLNQIVSKRARYLHDIDANLEIESLHFFNTDVQALGAKISDILGDRNGELSLTTTNENIETNLSDTVEVESRLLPGYEYDEDVQRTRKFSVKGVNKTEGNIEIVLNDQKGIEESGSW